MNGPADVGGAHGFGPVRPETDEPLFHAPWEREVFALTLAMGATGLWSIDRSRLMRESLPHARYYDASYYRIWLEALTRLIADTDLTPARPLAAAAVRDAIAKGGPSARPGPGPRFTVGDRVAVKPMRPAGHTRCPAYLRGRTGTVKLRHGCHVLPDTSAHGQGENPVPLYTVAFDAAELWGPDTTAGTVHADLFEPYLAAAIPPSATR